MLLDNVSASTTKEDAQSTWTTVDGFGQDTSQDSTVGLSDCTAKDAPEAGYKVGGLSSHEPTLMAAAECLRLSGEQACHDLTGVA